MPTHAPLPRSLSSEGRGCLLFYPHNQPGVKSIELVFPSGLCGVIRTDNADAAFQACLAAIEGGIGTIVGKIPIGVGTVWDPGAVGEAKEAGADFVVTPVVLPEVADACRKHDILCVLGALTPTEIYHARLAGANLVKVFPVGPVGGPEYIKALQGPMGGVPLWASGGIEIDQIPAYLRLGVRAVGLTGSLFPADALARRDMASIRETAARAAAAAAGARAD